MKPLRKLTTDSPELNQVQEYMQQALAPVFGCPLLSGVHIETTLATGTQSVAHKLGRKPQGYIIVGKSANIDVWGNTFSKANLELQSSGAVTVKIWVY